MIDEHGVNIKCPNEQLRIHSNNRILKTNNIKLTQGLYREQDKSNVFLVFIGKIKEIFSKFDVSMSSFRKRAKYFASFAGYSFFFFPIKLSVPSRVSLLSWEFKVY